MINQFFKIQHQSTVVFFVLQILFYGSCQTKLKDDVNKESKFCYKYGGITRGNKTLKEIALVYTGDEYADGGEHIIHVLNKYNIHASFFLTGKFYRNSIFKTTIETLIKEGHYIGAHSDQHLLYCDWSKKDSLLVTKHEFVSDLQNNYNEMKRFGVSKDDAQYFLPPYEWYNDSISAWTQDYGLILVNYSYGTLSHTDYTIPETKPYRSSKDIFQSIINYEEQSETGLNGFILLLHIGTHHDRKDKFYNTYLEELINELMSRGYLFKRIDELLQP